jgi:hypothetical protein
MEYAKWTLPEEAPNGSVQQLKHFEAGETEERARKQTDATRKGDWRTTTANEQVWIEQLH